MLKLKPISFDNINDFVDTVYQNTSLNRRQELIQSSIDKNYNGAYFEFFVVYDDNTVIGFMNLCAHSKHIISICPAIKTKYQRKGYGFLAEKMALAYAKNKGYTISSAGITEDNTASIALHEKLGFELDHVYVNKNGKTMRCYLKII